MKKYNVAIVGVTGLVGSTFVKILEEYNFPIGELRPLASSRSAGKFIKYGGKEILVQELTKDSFKGIDIALFSAGGSVSTEFAPIAVESGALVIDNSSAWRMAEGVPLVVPEVNPADIKTKGIIANPNCSTIQCMLPLKAIEKFGLKRIIYTTYQACSGSGIKGKDDLLRTRNGEKQEFYPYNISQTCIPEIDSFIDNGYTKEEMKMVFETRKIFHKEDLPISATCVRVPVDNAHAVNIYVELEKEFNLEEIREALENQEGIVLVDDPKNHIYPVSTIASGNDMVYVGRIRRDLSSKNGLFMYCVSDNVRKGAAGNAVQIALKASREIIKYVTSLVLNPKYILLGGIMKVAIVTDSNSGITQSEGKKLGISVVPMPFTINDKDYLEDINLTQEKFYEMISDGSLILTSQPSIGYITELWENLLKDYDEILHIPMSSGLSQSCQTAILLAKDFKDKVHVVDNQRISVIQKQSVLEAIEFVKDGKTAKQIKEELENRKTEASVYLIVEDLKYLKRGGRITARAAALGKLLKIKPVLQIQGGKIEAFEKARGMKSAKKIMLEAIKKDINERFNGIENCHVFIAYSYDKEEAEKFKLLAQQEFTNVDIPIDPLSLSVSCHVGPGSLAIACSKKINM